LRVKNVLQLLLAMASAQMALAPLPWLFLIP